MIISDHKGIYVDGPDADVEMHGRLARTDLFDNIYAWEHHHEYRSGKWAHPTTISKRLALR